MLNQLKKHFSKLKHSPREGQPQKSIAFWGVPPPPIGGMSVHIDRLSHALTMEGWEVCMYNFQGGERKEKNIVNISNLWIWYLGLLLGRSPSIHYVLTTRGYVRFLASLLAPIRGRKVVLRVGGQSLERGIASGGFSRGMNVAALKLCSGFIGVNRQICDLASGYTRPRKIHHIPGFIPPYALKLKAPKLVTAFLGNVDVRMVVTGTIPFEGEKDIYGLWDVLKVMKWLKHNLPNGVFRCCIVTYETDGAYSEKVNAFEKAIIREGMEKEILLYHNAGELWPILKAADLFLRPSYEDGDANSVREALFLGKRVIASDCVERPNGCITYPVANVDLFGRAIVKAADKNSSKTDVDGMNNLVMLKELLNNLL